MFENIKKPFFEAPEKLLCRNENCFYDAVQQDVFVEIKTLAIGIPFINLF